MFAMRLPLLFSLVVAVLSVVLIAHAAPLPPTANEDVMEIETFFSAEDRSLVQQWFTTETNDDFQRYLELTKHAYCYAKKSGTMSHGSTVVYQKFHNRLTGLSGYIALDHVHKEIQVVFRGTVNLRNWAFNLMFPWVKTELVKVGTVHAGFLGAYKSVREPVKTVVRKLALEFEDYELVFAGHSLGAAVATLAIADAYGLLEDHRGYLHLPDMPVLIPRSKATLFTVGSPRVGTDKFSKAFANAGFKRLVRLVNNADIVPHVPFRALGFRHIPQAYWMDDKGIIQKCDHDGEDGGACGNEYYGLKALQLSVKNHLLNHPNYGLQSCSAG